MAVSFEEIDVLPIVEGKRMTSKPTFAERVQAFRRQKGLTQEGFCEQYPVPIATLRNWEQGRCETSRMAIAFFTLIEKETTIINHLLAKHSLI